MYNASQYCLSISPYISYHHPCFKLALREINTKLNEKTYLKLILEILFLSNFTI